LIVALDPSVRSCGVATFVSQRLVHVERVTLRSTGDVAERCRQMALKIADTLPAGVAELVTEWPQIYRGDRSKVPAKSMPPMAGVGVAVGALIGATITSYLPKTWSNGIPKATEGDCRESPRSRRIRSRLDDAELELWALLKENDHDAIDAIGIGLFHLGRLKPIRVFAGAAD
jgi:hypothetical protein